MDDETQDTSSCDDWDQDEDRRHGQPLLFDSKSVKRSYNSMTNFSNKHQRRETIMDRKDKKIPFTVWMVMKIACVFHYRVLVNNRRCFHCQVKRVFTSVNRPASEGKLEKALLNTSLDISGQGYELADQRQFSDYTNPVVNDEDDCVVCESFWWNHEGIPDRYTESDIGVGLWNHIGSWLLSLVIIFAAIIIVMYDAVYYISSLWGEQKQIIHVISYATFMVNLALYPVLNIASKIRTCSQGKVPLLSWSTTLNARYMVKRMQYLGPNGAGASGKLFLFLGYGATLFHTIYRGKFYIDLCHTFSWHSGISVLCGGAIMFIFVNFQYLMYLTRLSLQRHFYLVNKFIEKHQGDLNRCRYILGSAVQDFSCYRQFVAVYMALFIPTSTWAITTHVTWQYFIGSKHHNSTYPDDPVWGYESTINILIWVEICTFLFTSLWATGGMDVTYMWKRLRLRVLTIRRHATHSFWHKMVRYMDYVNEESSGINMTMIFSVISFFMALQFGDTQKTVLIIDEPNCKINTTVIQIGET